MKPYTQAEIDEHRLVHAPLDVWRVAVAESRGRQRAAAEQEEAERVRRDAAALLAAMPKQPAAHARLAALALATGAPMPGASRRRARHRASQPLRDPFAYDGVIVPVLKKRRTTWAC